MTALPTDSTRTAMTAEKIAEERETAWLAAKAEARKAIYDTGRGMIGRERNYLEDRVARAIRAAEKRADDRLKARVAEMERKLLLTPMAERVAELPDFMAAMSEWGCEDPNEQADAITAFLNSAVGLREYLEDQSKAGGRDGH